jgi:hypothetical protein
MRPHRQCLHRISRHLIRPITNTALALALAFAILPPLIPTSGRAAVPAPAARPGEVIEKYDDGTLHLRYRVDAKKQKDGPYDEFFQGGKSRVKGAYTAGEKSGLWTTRDETGKVIESATYDRKGVLEGPYAYTAPATSRAGFRATYHLGEINGAVTVYDEKGRTARVINYPRPLPEIRQAWAALYPKNAQKPKFLEEPSAAAPYKPGKVAPESLEEALKFAKLYRYLSGVPWQQLALDPADCEKSQYGAVLLQKLGKLTHTPEKPDDMDDAFFKLAYAGCNQSNLHQGQANIAAGLRGFMDDSDDSNIAQIGHRRWVLKPGLRKVGFGFAGGFSSMHVLDGSGTVPEFNYAAFPGEGYYPRQLVEAHYAWSLHLASQKVKVAPLADLKVTITGLDEHYQPGEETTATMVNLIADGNQGWNVLVFKPNLKSLEPGRYWVDVTGLKSLRNDPTPFGYIVDLIDPAPKAENPPEKH